MKKLNSGHVFLLVAYCLAMVVVAYRFGWGNEYQQHQTVHTVQAGETFWDITEKYAQLDEKSRCLQEFQCNVEDDNPHLKPGRTYLQPGDKLTVVWYTVLNNDRQ